MSGSNTLLECAAELREQAKATRRAINVLKDAQHESWTTYMLMVGELEQTADNAVRAAWSALQRLEQLAKEAAP